jgi:hypothetical protein
MLIAVLLSDRSAVVLRHDHIAHTNALPALGIPDVGAPIN